VPNFIRVRKKRVEVIKDMSPSVLGSVYSVHQGEQGVMYGRGTNEKGEEIRYVQMDDTGWIFYFTIEMVKEFLKFIKPL
jgi:hypothetical protein